MSINLSVFEQILNKYKFTQPIPETIKDYMMDHREEILKDTLKKVGVYSVFYSIVLAVYFFLKKTGLSVGIFYCKIITSAAVIIAGVSISAGIVTTVRFVILPQLKHEKSSIEETSRTIVSAASNESGSAKNHRVVGQYLIGIGSFSSMSHDRETLNRAENIIINELQRIKGTEVVDIRNNNKGTSVKYLLRGTIETLGNLEILSVKVINIENLKIIFVADKALDNSTNLTNACLEIAEMVAQKI